MKLGPYIKPEKPKAKRNRKGPVRLAAERTGLTVEQLKWRIKRYGFTVEEAVAYRPMTPAESGRLGGKAKWRNEAIRRAN